MTSLAQLYRRFQASDFSTTAQPPTEFLILTKADNPWGKPVFWLNGQVWPLSNPALLDAYTSTGIFNTLVSRVRSHLLIHAGVVCSNGQGVILAADSGHGKTTLVVELVRRGFQFLSDETAALGRQDGQVHPFPRALGIRSGTVGLMDLAPLTTTAPTHAGKFLLDIEQIYPGSMGQAVPVNHIIILHNPAKPETNGDDSAALELTLFFDRLNSAFLAAIRGINGVTNVCPVSGLNVKIRIKPDAGHHVFTQIEHLCQTQQIWLLDMAWGSGCRPNFKGTPKLTPISGSLAAMELLHRFQGGYKSAILQEEAGGSASKLLMELAAVTNQAHCYHLSVGPLHQMANLVCDLAHAH